MWWEIQNWSGGGARGALGDGAGFLDWNLPLENVDDKQPKKTRTAEPSPTSFPFPGLKVSLFQIGKSYLEHMFLLYNTFPSTPQKLLHSLHSAAVLFPSNNALLSSGISHPCFVTSWNYSVTETSNWETKHHIWRVGELRFITPAGPEELTFQALSPEQRGYRVFTGRLQWATLAALRLV